MAGGLFGRGDRTFALVPSALIQGLVCCEDGGGASCIQGWVVPANDSPGMAVRLYSKDDCEESRCCGFSPGTKEGACVGGAGLGEGPWFMVYAERIKQVRKG